MTNGIYDTLYFLRYPDGCNVIMREGSPGGPYIPARVMEGDETTVFLEASIPSGIKATYTTEHFKIFRVIDQAIVEEYVGDKM